MKAVVWCAWVALLVVACKATEHRGSESESAAEQQESPPASGSEDAQTAEPIPPAPDARGNEAPPQLAVPSPKAYTSPTDDAVGTLPEGVGIAVGSAAPDFTLPGVDGKPVERDILLARGELLVVFYRGGW